MEDIIISVIVPAYNIDTYIGRCLNSILKQTYENIEIIVVDDGSTDRTLEILNQYEERYDNIVVVHQENQGVFSARLNGLRRAKGDWIGFVDEIEEEMYFSLMKNALDYQADISHCGYQMNFPDRVDLYYGTDKIIYQDNHNGLKDLLSGIFIEPALVNKLFRKNLFEGIEDEKGLDSSIKINEDLLMNYYLFRKAKRAVFYDKCYYHYMIRKNSASTSKINKNKLEDPYKVLMILLAETKEDPKLNQIVEERYVRYLVGTATMSLADNPDLIRPYQQDARKKLKNELKRCIHLKFNKKLKILVIWAALFPTLYRKVHEIYAHITGTDKKYEIK